MRVIDHLFPGSPSPSNNHRVTEMISFRSAAFLIPLLAVIHHGLSAGFKYRSQKDWSGDCKVGKSQSPINIQVKKTKIGTADPFSFINYDEPCDFVVHNNGHSISVKVEPDYHKQMIGVVGGDLRAIYMLDHFHFHWRAEHLIEGKRKPLEVHLVHYKREYKNVSNAAQYPDGLAVLGVLYEESATSNPTLDFLLPHFSNTSEQVLVKPKHLLLESLIPKDGEGFFRYKGSLTTPPCSESVTWTVFKDTLPISKAQIDQLQHIHFNGEYENWREVQPLYNRELTLIKSRNKQPLSCSSKRSNPLCLLLALAGVIPSGIKLV